MSDSHLFTTEGRQQWYRHVAKLNGTEPYKLTEHPLTASYIYPGPDFSAIDRDDVYSIAHLMRYIEHSTNYPDCIRTKKDGQSFLSRYEICKERLLFIVTTKITLSRRLNDKSVNKWLLNVEKRIRHVGKSTVTVEGKFSCPGIEEPLFKSILSVVHVDMDTRQAISLPHWYLQRYKDQGTKLGPLRMVPPEKPESTFCQRIQVWWTDTDGNNHANYVSYVYWFQNTLHCCLSSREESRSRDHSSNTSVIMGLTKETLKNGVKELEIAYMGECQENDVVDVHIWQVEGHEFVVNCLVEKDGALVCAMIVEYYGPTAIL